MEKFYKIMSLTMGLIGAISLLLLTGMMFILLVGSL